MLDEEEKLLQKTTRKALIMASKTGRKANAAAERGRSIKTETSGARYQVFDLATRKPAYLSAGSGLSLEEATRLATGRVQESYLVQV
jgi:hypothetical protein